MKYFFVLVFLLIHINIYAQSYKIDGTIKDATTPLIGATVVVLSQADSIMLAFGLTDDNGNFEIYDVESGDHFLQITYTGYQTKVINFQLGLENQVTSFGEIILEESTEMLDVVSIKAEHIPMGILGDTINYNAAAFKTKPGASVEDLLKKLPGIEVARDGSIKAQGKDVEKVLVDGKEFFSNDPTIATKNLDAEAVDKVQVFDKKSEEAEFTGIDDGVEEKTINLTLKEGYKNGGFGKIAAEAGTEDTRNVKLNYNAFGPKIQASVIGSHNNINRQSFSFNEYVDFLGGLQQAISAGGGSYFGNHEAPQGINTQNAIGSNLNVDFSKKLALNLNYLYADQDINLRKSSLSKTFTDDFSFSTQDTITSGQNIYNHRISGKLKYKLNPSTNLTLITKLFSLKNHDNNKGETSYFIDNIQQNTTTRNNENLAKTFDLDTQLNFKKKYGKKGRNWITNLGYKRTNRNQILDLNNLINYQSIDEVILQQQVFENGFSQITGETKYTEPVGFGLYLTGRYNYGHKSQEPSRNYYDQDTGVDILNRDLSGTFSHHWINHKAGLSLKRNRKKLKIEGGVSIINTVLQVGDESTELDKKSIENFILPALNFDWKFKSNRQFRVGYQSRVEAPTLNQLVTQNDNQNPNFLILGNPDLSPEVFHTLSLNYSKFDLFNFSNLFTNLSFSMVQDKIVNARNYSENLITEVRPINTKNYMQAVYYLSFGHPIRPLKIRYQINSTIQYSNYQTLINNVENQVSSGNITLDLRFENRKKDKVDAAVGLKTNINANKNDQFSNFNNPFFNYSLYTDIFVDLTKSINVNLTYDFLTFNNGFIGKRQVLNLVNMTLSKSFLDEKFSLKLTAHDILNQNKGINRNGGVNSINDTQYNTLGRYFMLGASYTISAL